jgi:predicted kinase
MRGVADAPQPRSVKIADDERGGWSSDRPRRDGRPPRPPDISVRCQVLAPTDRLRYSPGSLVVVVSASAAERDRFVERVISERGVVLSLERVRGLLAGRVADDEIEERAAQLLDAAVLKRLEASETVVLPVEGLTPGEREPYLRAAARLRRPRHLVLLEVGRDQLSDEDRGTLNELRRALDAGELGQEGFHTALRLSGDAISELKAIVFASAPVEE